MGGVRYSKFLGGEVFQQMDMNWDHEPLLGRDWGGLPSATGDWPFLCALWPSLVGNFVESVQQGNRCSPMTNAKFIRRHWLSAHAPKSFLPPGVGGTPSAIS